MVTCTLVKFVYRGSWHIMTVAPLLQDVSHMVKPERIFSLRKNGSGVLPISANPARLQESADAINFLMSINHLKGKSEVILDCLLEMARLIEENPEMRRFLEDE